MRMLLCGRLFGACVRVRRDPATPRRRGHQRISRALAVVVVTLVAFAALGLTGARLGGADQLRATARVTVWGAAAMAVTDSIGAVVGTAV
jgi:VIT1/CCC1 family predicted Fe2+/Mn2+ transporter